MTSQENARNSQEKKWKFNCHFWINEIHSLHNLRGNLKLIAKVLYISSLCFRNEFIMKNGREAKNEN